VSLPRPVVTGQGAKVLHWKRMGSGSART